MLFRSEDGLPSALEARQERLGYAESLEYYESNYGQSEKTVVTHLKNLGAGDAFSWFSFPGGHAFPGVARRMTFAWFDRWLGRSME